MTSPLWLVPENAPDVRSAALVLAHLDWMRVRGLRAATISARRGSLARTGKKLPCPLIQVTVEQLRQWQEGLQMGPYGLSTETAYVGEFYRWAMRQGQRQDNPADLLPRVKITRSLPRPISEADLKMALVCAPARIRPWLILAGCCGLRARELARLERVDIRD